MSKPISPDQIVEAKRKTIPDAVIDSFNELIAEKWDGRAARVMQPDVVTLIKNKLDCDSDRVFDSHWLDVEDIYREIGWNVAYDKPGYDESFEAYFTFTKKR